MLPHYSAKCQKKTTKYFIKKGSRGNGNKRGGGDDDDDSRYYKKKVQPYKYDENVSIEEKIRTAITENNYNKTKNLITRHPQLIKANNDKKCNTFLHLAVHIDAKIVTLLIEHGHDLNVVDHSNRTPLHVAVLFAQEKMVKIFIAKNADLNVVDDKGRTPLINATIFKHVGCLKLLLESSADRNVKDNDGKIAFEYAESENIKKLFV